MNSVTKMVDFNDEAFDNDDLHQGLVSMVSVHLSPDLGLGSIKVK